MTSLVDTERGQIRTAVPVLDGLDFFYMAFVFLIASDAFTFLGLHSVLWLMAYGYAVIRIAMLFPEVVGAALRNWVFLLYPGLCLISVLWSDLPKETLRFSIQLSFTVVIAIFIGMRFSLWQIFVALAGVLFVSILVSLANLNGALSPAYDHRNNFKGIFLSKNALGHRAVLFSATCTFGIVLIPGLRAMTRLALLFALAVNVFLISISGSATAAGLSGVLSLAGLFLWLLLGRRGGWSVITLLIAPPLAVVVFAFVAFQVDPVSGLLHLLGRDPTLTGRTVLWEFAISHLGTHPILGFGASGFWNHPALQNQILILQSTYGDGVGGFHNLILELLIMLGPLGLIVHTMAVLTTLSRGVRRARLRDDPLAVWAVTLTLGMYAMALFGAQLFQQHAIPLILVVVLGVSLGEAARIRGTI